MDSETAIAAGRAVALYFRNSRKIVLGKDTRASGDMIMYALVSGVCSAGCDAVTAGVLPTPAVAVLAREIQADAGLVVSASHNPYYDNGVKVFQGDGAKLSDKQESEIERIALAQETAFLITETDIGSVSPLPDAERRYIGFLKSAAPPGFSLKGLKIAADCSNGAVSRIAPALFSELGADIEIIHGSPDGKNINHECGSEHPEELCEKVVSSGAHIGFAFDGDGDRLIAVDENGGILTGDHILAISAGHMKEKGTLKNNVAVSTVMSNKGLTQALKKMGIRHLTADVGDRYVKELMVESGAVIGGEDSGHMIYLDSHTTGDGLLTALKLIESVKEQNRPLSELRSVVTIFPQILMNVEIARKPPIESVPELMKAIRAVEERLGENGRVLVRYSGTQPCCRVMVEGPDRGEIEQYCREILETVSRTIGS